MSNKPKTEEKEIQPESQPAGTAEPAPQLNTAFADHLPDVEKEMEAERQKLLAGQDTAPEPAPPPPETETEPQAAPSPGQPKADPEPKPEAKPQETLEQKVARLEGEIRKRDGRHGSDKQSWMAEREELKDQLSAATAQLTLLQATERTAAQTTPARPGPQSKIADPTNEQLKELFGDDYEDNLGHDYAKRLYLAQERLMANRIAEERAQVEKLVASQVEKQMQTRQHASRLDKAFDEIEAKLPGARELNEQADINGFGDYLDESFAETAIPRRQIAQMAIDAIQNGATGDAYKRHLATLSTIFGGFSAGGTPPASAPAEPASPAPKAPQPTDYVGPNPTGAEAKPSEGSISMKEAEARIQKATQAGGEALDAELKKINALAKKGLIRP